MHYKMTYLLESYLVKLSEIYNFSFVSFSFNWVKVYGQFSLSKKFKVLKAPAMGQSWTEDVLVIFIHFYWLIKRLYWKSEVVI